MGYNGDMPPWFPSLAPEPGAEWRVLVSSHLINCPACHKRNRVPERPGTPKCGACGAKLPAPSDPAATRSPGKPVEVTDQTFTTLVLGADRPVLVDVWAPWCGPCRMQSPVLEKLARDHGDNLLVAKLNADENPRTVGALGVQGLPTLLLVRGGKVMARQAGFMPEAHLLAWLRQPGGLQLSNTQAS